MRTRDLSKEKAIKTHALKMIVKHGFDGLSMQKLAKAAGVSPATIYIYFKDRDDLIVQLFAEVNDRAFRHTMKGFDPTMPFAEGLRIQWLNRAAFFLKHPDEMHFLEQVRYSPLHERALKASKAPFQQAMKTFLTRAVKNGDVVPVPVEVYWSIAFAPLYQLIKFHMHGKGLPGTGPFALDEKTLLMTLELVLKALRP